MPSHPIRSAVVLILAVLVCASAAHAQETLVVQWNAVTLQAVRNTRFAPTLTARALAIVHTCMYDAWAAYDPAAIGTRYGGRLRRPPRERTDAARETAVSYAAYRALVNLFPSQKAALFDPMMTTLGLDPADTSTDMKTAAGIGNRAAAAVLQFRHADGSNQLGDLNPGAYSDYTGYAPVNTADHLQDPNRWQPLRAANGAVQTFLTPHWGLVTPFAIKTVEKLRPDQPPLFPEKAYRREVAQILHLSGRLDDRRKVIASYWADGPSTETPPGHWNLFAQFVSHRDAHTLEDDVKMFFVLGNALLDASIAVWDTKRFHDYVRPLSAIQYLYAGKRVLAWGGPFRGTETMLGEQFQSYTPTPPFAEYVSGHSTFSAASAEILRRFTSSDRFGASVTIAAGSSAIEPGLVPAADVVLVWRTFSDAADQAGLSRRYGGIHFESGDLEARALGRRVGRRVWEKARALFLGYDRHVLQPSQGDDASESADRDSHR
jgi:hypothetical protein